jgi:hypothetical protein
MFETLLLGHLVGDYLLQNKWMALTKSKPTLEGWFAAFTHCFIYTISISMFMQNFDWIWIFVVFNSHFWIDKFALGERYKKFIGSSTLKEFVHRGETGLDNVENGVQPINRREVIEGGFATLTYTITDNTMHLVLMYLAYQMIY